MVVLVFYGELRLKQQQNPVLSVQNAGPVSLNTDRFGRLQNITQVPVRIGSWPGKQVTGESTQG